MDGPGHCSGTGGRACSTKLVGHCVANAAAAGDQNKARDMVTEATQAIARIKT